MSTIDQGRIDVLTTEPRRQPTRECSVLCNSSHEFHDTAKCDKVAIAQNVSFLRCWFRAFSMHFISYLCTSLYRRHINSVVTSPGLCLKSGLAPEDAVTVAGRLACAGSGMLS